MNFQFHASLTNSRICGIIFLQIFLVFSASAQNADENILPKVSKYHAINHHEKIFVQTDRPVYLPGEELWFSAFLLNASSQQLNQSESVLYLELVSPVGITRQKNIFKLNAGRAWGSILLDQNLKSGDYYLIAYTNWMRNSGSDYYFSKQIHISAEAIELPPDTIALQSAGNNDTAVEYEETTSSSEIHLSFFPEGGTLIEGILSKLAFEAVNENGSGIDLDALVVDDTGEIICAAKTLWRGKGFFMLTPQAGKEYFIRVNSENQNSQEYKLPEAQSDGLTFSVKEMTKQKQIKVNVSRKGNLSSTKSAVLLSMQNGVPVKAFSIDFDNTQNVDIVIDKSEFRSGIVQFTLFDEARNPLAERLFFVKGTDKLNINLTENSLTDRPRGEVKLTMQVTDSNGNPVEGDFALSVTDAHRIPDAAYHSPDIFKYLTLYADLPDYKSMDSSFFENTVEGNVKSELLMLTNGWRRYYWQEVLSDTIAIPEFLEEPGIYVTGTVQKSPKSKRIPEDAVVTMVTGGKNMELFSEKVGEDGTFTFLLKDFEDTLRAVVQTKNRIEAKKDLMINLTTNYHARSVDTYQNQVEAYRKSQTSDIFKIKPENPKIEKGVLEKQLVRAMSKDTFVVTTDYSIGEVTVEGERTKSQKEEMTEKYGSPEHSVGKKRISELVEEKPWQYGLMTILSDAFPNLRLETKQASLINNRYGGIGPPPQSSTITFSNSPSISMRLIGNKMHRFFIFVDGELIAASGTNGLIRGALGSYTLTDLISLDPNVVTSVDLIFPRNYGSRTTLNSDASFLNTSEVPDAENPPDELQALIGDSENMSTPSAILSIYTKDGAGLYSPTNYKGLSNITLHGFTRVKEFYQHNYSGADADSIVSDLRNTLAWFPKLCTDSSGKADFSFYTSDASATFRVEANGISSTGAMGALRYKMQEPMFNKDSVSDLISTKDLVNAPFSPGNYRILLPDSSGAAYAMVMCPQKNWCTFTSPEGYFSVDETCLEDECELVISKSGYQSLTQLVDSTMSGAVMLVPLPDSSSTLDVMEVLSNFYRYTDRNYYKKDYFLEGAYRELLFNGKELHQLTDYSFVQRRKRPTSANLADYHINSGRRFRSDDFKDKINFVPQNRFHGAIPVMDPIFANVSFLNRAARKQYEYILKGVTWFEGRKMYHIYFDQADDTPWALYSGELLIDAETFGLAWASWCISDKGKKYLMPDEFLSAGGDPETFVLEDEHNEISWSYTSELWIPRFAISTVSFRQNEQQNTVSREVVWNPGDGRNYRPLIPENMNQRLVFKNAPEYKPEDWRKPWLLPPSKEIPDQVRYLINITEYR
ncbi:MG2 domain-containing protein [Maribellus sediminis]|uniref:MG2 domain-containing protein n=1 Tax=Maribellus sediminis TaxID=2696285 RepID=UPI00143173FE|nr:MG2 domain-containing protein [Maribellus sediminis]